MNLGEVTRPTWARQSVCPERSLEDMNAMKYYQLLKWLQGLQRCLKYRWITWLATQTSSWKKHYQGISDIQQLPADDKAHLFALQMIKRIYLP
jgi:hypothetical protein